MTERDTLDLVLRRFGDDEIYDRVEAELEAGRMTLNEVIAAEFATVTAPLDEVVAYVVEHARVRPGFAELARERHPLVVSSGFHELIEPVLEREGVLGEVELRREPGRRAGRRLARRSFASSRPVPSAASRASGATFRTTARSSTRATATRTTARRSLPTASTRREAWRATSTSAVSPTSR